MILKIPGSTKEKIEEIYLESIPYRNKKISFSMGSVLTELLQVDFKGINDWIQKQLGTLENNHFNMNECESFQILSEKTKLMLLYCSELRFLRHRILKGNSHIRNNYFFALEQTISFIKKTVDEKKDNIDYFAFFFRHLLRICNPDSLYESGNDLNILNYIFPIALYCTNHGLTKYEPEYIYELLSQAEEDKSKIQDVINCVPTNTVYREMVDTIHNYSWSPNRKGYSVVCPKNLNSIADLFIDSEELRIKFLEIIYEYKNIQSDQLYSFRQLHEYIGLCTIECYKNGFPICKCGECGKYFVRMSNSRRLCGNPECTSQNKKRAAQQRKSEFQIDDTNVLSAVYKSLCYSKIGKAKSALNDFAYKDVDGITPEMSKKIVLKLKDGLINKYRINNKKYKNDIRKAESERSKMLLLYYQWLDSIKSLYSHQYVVDCYKKSMLADINSKESFALDFFEIDNWKEIKTTKYQILK